MNNEWLLRGARLAQENSIVDSNTLYIFTTTKFESVVLPCKTLHRDMAFPHSVYVNSSATSLSPFEYSAFKCFCPFSALNISGSHFLPLSLLQAIPIPVAREEDPGTLGKHHECAKADSLLGDHLE